MHTSSFFVNTQNKLSSFWNLGSTISLKMLNVRLDNAMQLQNLQVKDVNIVYQKKRIINAISINLKTKKYIMKTLLYLFIYLSRLFLLDVQAMKTQMKTDLIQVQL